MKKIGKCGLTTLFVIFCLVFMGYPVSADDTCVFSVTADDLPPNIVLLLDNGAEMEQVVWWFEKDGDGKIIKKFDNSIDYTPEPDSPEDVDVVKDPENGNGFFNDNGYGIIITGNEYYLVDIPVDDLDISNNNFALKADVTDAPGKKGKWKINERTITLPAEPSTVAVDGVIDNATHFRYSKNYLNWLFFAAGSGSYIDVSSVSSDDYGADLPKMSRFYKAKEAIMTVASGTGNKAKFGIYYFSNDKGATRAQPLEIVADANGILTSAFKNNINNMHTVIYSPLAEGLSTVGGYYSSPSSGASGGYCQSNFTIVLSSGISSKDQVPTSKSVPEILKDYDGDNAAGGIFEGNIVEDNTHDGIDNDNDGDTDESDEAVSYKIPMNQEGSTFLDDIAYYLYSHDIVGDAPSSGSLCYDTLTTTDVFNVGETIEGDTSGATGYIAAVNVDIGTLSGCLELESVSGTFENDEIITSSNNNSAKVNGSLFDSGEGYQNVFTYTVGFMGDKEGNLFLINTSNNGNGKKNLYNTSDKDYGKYHFTAQSPDALSAQLLAAVNSILSKTSTFMAPVVPVTRTTSGDKIYMAFFKPSENNFWEGNVTKYGISSANQIVDAQIPPVLATWFNGAMKDDAVPYWATIDWADISKSNGILNSSRTIYTCLNNSTLTSFNDSNTDLTSTGTILGNPTRTISEIINYVRGADIFDENGDTHVDDNRSIITGDVLHSEPVIVKYRYADGTSKTMVYFGANDGMLHAVLDEENPSTAKSPGTEMWAFIPPDQLPRLKEMVEGFGHQSYVDSTPKIYLKDNNHNGIVEPGVPENDEAILVCGERKGGTGYFALDITNPFNPLYLWRINQNDNTGSGWASPTTVIPELGETWSEPQFGLVKTSAVDTNGTPVFFVGGGYSSNNSSGKTVIAINVTDGSIIKQFGTIGSPITDMDYAIPSNVLVIDEDDNGFVDKVYVGDLGGQVWRLGSCDPSAFPDCNEDINTWTAHVFFKTDSSNSRKFFYSPSVTLEKGYDMVFMGTGDREDACNATPTTPDMIAAVKETHSSLTTIVGETDLVDVTDPTATPPNLTTDLGWYIRLVDGSGSAVGEKVLAESVVFYKTLYITTFTPNEDPCAPGGDGKLYALSHLTGEAVLDFDNDSNNDRSVTIGGGIPSKPVTLITRTGTKLLISVGSSNPDAASPSFGAGIRNIDPLLPPINFFYKFWKEVF